MVASSHFLGKHDNTARLTHESLLLSVFFSASFTLMTEWPSKLSNCHAKWPCPRYSHVSRGWPFLRDNWHFCWKTNNNSFYPAAPSSHSSKLPGSEMPPSSPQRWADWDASCLKAGQVLTQADSNPIVYRIELVCSSNIHCFTSVFTRVWKQTHYYISANSF